MRPSARIVVCQDCGRRIACSPFGRSRKRCDECRDAATVEYHRERYRERVGFHGAREFACDACGEPILIPAGTPARSGNGVRLHPDCARERLRARWRIKNARRRARASLDAEQRAAGYYGP